MSELSSLELSREEQRADLPRIAEGMEGWLVLRRRCLRRAGPEGRAGGHAGIGVADALVPMRLCRSGRGP